MDVAHHAEHLMKHLLVHHFFGTAPSPDPLAPDLTDLEVDVTAFEDSLPLLPLFLVFCGYDAYKLSKQKQLHEAVRHFLLTPESNVEVDVLAPELSKSVPLLGVELLHAPIEVLLLLSQVHDDLQVLIVLLRQNRPLERGNQTPLLIHHRSFGNVSFDVVPQMQAQPFRLLLVSVS